MALRLQRTVVGYDDVMASILQYNYFSAHIVLIYGFSLSLYTCTQVYSYQVGTSCEMVRILTIYVSKICC